MARDPKPRLKEKTTRKPHFTDKAQSERFVEAARKHGVEESTILDKVIGMVVIPKRT